MTTLIYIFLIVLGLIFGSFYLVVATRLPKEESIIKPGSHCDNCKHELKWYELIPVVSYIIQKGKCRKCGSKIPFITVLIEIITGACFALSYYLYGLDYKFYALIVLLSISIIIFISDFKYYIISDEPLFTSIFLIVLLKFVFFGTKAFVFSILSGIVLFMVFLFVKFFGDRAFKKESLGGGDIKLAILIGVTLGVKLGLASFILSTFIAFPYALFISLKKKEGIVPFGPFLISGLIIVFIYMSEIGEFISKLYSY